MLSLAVKKCVPASLIIEKGWVALFRPKLDIGCVLELHDWRGTGFTDCFRSAVQCTCNSKQILSDTILQSSVMASQKVILPPSPGRGLGGG
jgi:hypothetical protein